MIGWLSLKCIHLLVPIGQLLFLPERRGSLEFVVTEFVQFINIVDLFFVQVGQMQLIRRQISNELNCSCKFDSQVLYNALGTFNK